MPSLGVAISVTAAGVATGVALATGLQIVGPQGAVIPLVALAGAAVLAFPEIALALLVVGAVIVEAESPGIVPPVNSFYEVVEASVTPQDIFLILGFGGVLIRLAVEGRRPRLPEPFVLPLALLGIAVVAGVITGATAATQVSAGELFHRAVHAYYVILVPLLTVNVLRSTRALKIFAALAAALAAYKGISGLYSAFRGLGTTVEEETITYLSPVPNFVMLVFVLGVVAAIVRRVRLPAWMYATAPLAVLALILSYRRSFWIAAAFTIAIVIILASRRRGRAVAALTGAAVALTLGATVLVGSYNPSESPLTERVRTLAPGEFGTNRGDRYRMDERRNAIENIRRHPLTGNGLGVPWSVHFPLAEAHDRRYVHFGVIWYWLAFGLFGLAAYLALFGTALWAAWRIWQRHADGYVQIAALAAFGGVLAMLVVELTATFTGVEPRTSIIFGALLGWLAAAWLDLPQRDRPHGRALT